MTMSDPNKIPGSGVITIERHILWEQERFPDSSGALTSLLYDIALAAKLIASRTQRAGLADILGSTGHENVQGEEVQKLDEYAQRTLYQLNDHTGRLCCMASEEEKDLIPIPDQYPTGDYVLVFDPLDGSSNIDFNVAVGTIFAIFRRVTKSGPGKLEDALQNGRQIVAGGYLVYGSSTMLVYTTGHGVNGFTLDPSIGEFLLSHPNVKLPSTGKYYSANQGHEKYWTEGVRRYTQWLQGEEGSPMSLSLRYIGSMVADVHRTLFGGGVFYYPADTKDPSKPHGKLRLLYEAMPMAYVIEQAGGYGSTGRGPILDVTPKSLHERTPVYVGNRDIVKKAEELISKYDR
ncbi:MAG TPA: class 1 fructose-bisphosphatase [Candidatus Krumholzibacteria bacterium]|jgi:fructose-1,6-bisphosphatase I|nr:class 1 fructose-bisphosphatase [Candidatus Krumholzibacteria bacterium]